MNVDEVRALAAGQLAPTVFNDITHCDRVLQVALFIAATEGTEVDETALALAAYLHDLGVLDGIPGHEDRSADQAVEILARVDGLAPETGQTALDCIRNHTFSRTPATVTGKVFRDADLLDLLGAVGVCRLATMSHKTGKGFGPVLALLPTVTSNLKSCEYFSQWAAEQASARAALSERLIDALNVELSPTQPA